MTSIQYDQHLARRYAWAQEHPHPLSALVYDTWKRRLGDVRGKRVLDLVCGSGTASRMLASMGALVTAVDISPDMIEQAMQDVTQRTYGIRYICADANGLELGETFHTVTPTFLLHYAPDMDTLSGMIETVARHLAEGGKMVALNTPPDPIVPQMEHMSHWTEWVDQAQAYQEGAQVRLHLLDYSGEEVRALLYHYWSQGTYEQLLRTFGLDWVQWVPHVLPRALREQYPNWEELQRFNASCVLEATKR